MSAKRYYKVNKEKLPKKGRKSTIEIFLKMKN